MLANIHCAAVQGIAAHPVEVEVNDGYGETLVVIVGLPDAAVRESRDRVTTALTNSGFKMPLGRTIADLAAADSINSEHISETLQYRTLDRQLWG